MPQFYGSNGSVGKGLLIPTSAQVRQRIDNAGDLDNAMALRACYLCCARVSEIVGENYGSQNLARGPRGIDAKDVYWESGPVKEKALVIDIHTAKRSGLLRRLGLAPDYDSWVLPMGQYFWSKG